MQMQEDVRQNAQRAIARRVVMFVAEDRSEHLSLGGIFQAFDLLFGFRWHVRLEGLDILFYSSLHPFEQAYPIAVLAVSILFRHWFLLSYFSVTAQPRAAVPTTQSTLARTLRR